MEKGGPDGNPPVAPEVTWVGCASFVTLRVHECLHTDGAEMGLYDVSFRHDGRTFSPLLRNETEPTQIVESATVVLAVPRAGVAPGFQGPP